MSDNLRIEPFNTEMFLLKIYDFIEELISTHHSKTIQICKNQIKPCNYMKR